MARSAQKTSQQPTNGTHERPNECRERTYNKRASNLTTNSNISERNSRQRTSNGKQNTRCLCVWVGWVGRSAHDANTANTANAANRTQRVGYWREHRTCVCACVWFDVKPKQAKTQNQNEGHTKSRMLYESKCSDKKEIKYM